MTATQHHPTVVELTAFARRRLSPRESATVEDHLGRCGACRTLAAALVSDTFIGRRTRASGSFDEGDQTVTADGQSNSSIFSTGSWEPGSGPDTPRPRSNSPLEIPSELVGHPKYRVLRLLGCGGMGTVWLAEHLLMTRLVAVKVIRPDVLARPGAVERFLREIHAVSQLHHPNIVTAHDAEPLGESCLLAMELITGGSLADEVAAGRLPVREACRAIRDAALGLAHAHEVGLVHRDVKPHNLMRSADGMVKVLDFGLASATVAADRAVRASTTLVCGTPDYLPPEQMNCPGDADTRSDVYGLGCTFYHLLAGHPPFPGGTLDDKFRAHRTREPKPIPDLPKGLSAILKRMTAKAPVDRYQTAAEIALALEPFCAIPPKRARGRWLVNFGLLFAFLVLACGFVVYRIQTDHGELVIESADPNVEVVVQQAGQVVTVYDPKSGQKLVLKSGQYEVELKGKPTGLRLDLERVTLRRGDKVLAKVTRIPAPERASVPAPGPSRIVVPAVPTRFVPNDNWSGHTHLVSDVVMTPDGKRAVSLDSDGLLLVRDFPGGKVRHEIKTTAGAFASLAVSPNGKLLAVGGCAENMFRWFDLETGKEMDGLVNPTGRVRGVAFTRDSKQLLAAGLTGAALWDLETKKEVRSFNCEEMVLHGVAISPDGTRILVAGGKDTGAGWHQTPGEIRIFETATGKCLATLTGPMWAFGHAAFSVDGKRVAGACLDGTARIWDIATGKECQVFRHPTGSWVEQVAFTPDGRHLVTNFTHGSPNRATDTLTVWELKTGLPRSSVEPIRNGGYGMAVTPNGRAVLLGDAADGTLRVYPLPQVATPTDTRR